MKKINVFLFPFFFSTLLFSQDYIPLKIDSFYYWAWAVDPEGNTIIQESYAAYSYDSNDSLIQLRNPAKRFNYTYGLDTTYLISEILDTNNTWQLFSRSKTAFENGYITSELNEKYANGDWENSARHQYFYSPLYLDTLYLLQHWDDSGWVNFYKKEKVFDSSGNNIEEAEFYTDNDGFFKYNGGKTFEYNNLNLKTKDNSFNSSINGIYPTSELSWIYGNDELLDTFIRCHFFGDVCENRALSVHEYLGEDSIIIDTYIWEDDEWKDSRRELIFNGEGIYSDKPDSIITYHHWADSLFMTSTQKRFLRYEDLGNNRVYFIDEEYDFNVISGTWELRRIREEWYHVAGTINSTSIKKEQNESFLFPNPCRKGSGLFFKNIISGSDD